MAIAIVSPKGKAFKPVLCTSPADFIRKFGQPDPTYSLAMYAAFEALGGDAALSGDVANARGTNQLYVMRAVGAGGMIALMAYSKQYAQFNQYQAADPSAYVFPSDESFIIAAIGPGKYASDPSAGISIGITNVNTTAHTFDINVYANTNLNVPVETWTVSKQSIKDGRGRALYLEDAINPYSNYIQVYDNPAITDDPETPGIPTPVSFTLGADGGLVNDGLVIQAWQALQGPRITPVAALINGGFASPAVHQFLATLASSRVDAEALLDVPSELQDPQLATAYRQSLNIAAYDATLFSPDYQYYDPRLGRSLWVPASGAAAANMAYTANNYDVWWPFAGDDRGACPTAQDLRWTYEDGDIALMYDNEINCLVRDSASGIYIDGNRTLLGETSALESTHVAILVKNLLIQGQQALRAMKFVFNNDRTRQQAADLIKAIAQPVKDREGLYDFAVVCDDTNNTPDTIDAQEMYVDFYIKPARDAEWIKYTVIVNRTDAVLPSTNS